MRYAAEVSYDGGLFHGWQLQPGLPTVQLAMEEAAAALDGGHVAVAGAGRTDAGVHARAQVCSFDMRREWEPRGLTLALNAHLPPGVSVMRAARVDGRFHARFSAVSREYRYFIWNSGSIYPHAKRYAAWLKYGGYDWTAAARAAKFLEGRHDFRNFCRLEDGVRSTVRSVERARLVRRGRLVVFQIRGDGFLHNMVRIILGSLELAALGKIRPDEIGVLLDAERSTRADGGRTFPACGLWFWKALYNSPIW